MSELSLYGPGANKGGEDAASSTTLLHEHTSEPIAIIGLACRFPGGENIDAFWRLLRNGADAIGEIAPDRWDVNAFYDANHTAPGKINTRYGGFLKGVDLFDPLFFGISPREAVQMDPQQRLMLEVSWEALEDAGLPAEALKDHRTGVFFGAMWDDYTKLLNGNLTRISPHTVTGQNPGLIANRVSYVFDLRGPSVVINTASSSSLVAVHMACQSLRCRESSIALAGGVSLMLAPDNMVAISKLGVLASDKRSKPFDAQASGYVRGEGAGVVVLKPLSSALAAGDSIYAVIRASAVNNDGFSNGLAAPSLQAQKIVLQEAYEKAGLSPDKVHYVEAHGTGTILGDSIEAAALGAILGAGRRPERPLIIGSVKSNIGHLEAAAGVAGLIKVALSLHHRLIPPSLHTDQLNPRINFAELGLQVQQGCQAWSSEDSPYLAGVSSFGLGGTNCHVVVSEFQDKQLLIANQPAGDCVEVLMPSTLAHEISGATDERNGTGQAHLFPLTGRSEEGLGVRAGALAHTWHRRRFWLDTPVDAQLEESGGESGTGGGEKAVRDALVGASIEGRRDAIEDYLRERVARVLMLDETGIDIQQPLIEQGIDSLMAFELKNRIETELEVSLPPGNHFYNLSVAQLALETLELLVIKSLVSSPLEHRAELADGEEWETLRI